jgi:hypothetical protein
VAVEFRWEPFVGRQVCRTRHGTWPCGMIGGSDNMRSSAQGVAVGDSRARAILSDKRQQASQAAPTTRSVHGAAQGGLLDSHRSAGSQAVARLRPSRVPATDSSPRKPLDSAAGGQMASLIAADFGDPTGLLARIPRWAVDGTGTPGSETIESQRQDGRDSAGTGRQQKASRVLDVVGKGDGHPLVPEVRKDMEQRLSADFADVRIHTDAKAAESAEAVSAEAYTVGNEIVFGSGAFAPDTPAGKARLAHELSHVQQQRKGPVSGTDTGSGVVVSNPSDPLEQQAHTTASRVFPSAQPVAGSGAGHDGGAAAHAAPQPGGQLALQRQPKAAAQEPSQPKIKADDVVSAVEPKLEEWRRNAGEGVTVFAVADLNDAIRNQHFDDASWSRVLAGNLGLTFAVFITEAAGGIKFALDAARILNAAPPFKTDKKDTTLTTIEKRMLNYLDGLQNVLSDQLPRVSAQVVANPDVNTKEQALERVLRLLFRPEFLIPPQPDPWGDRVKLNGSAIRDVYQHKAEHLLRQYREQIAPIRWGQGNDIPMVIRISGVGLALASWRNNHGDWEFIRWIDPEMREEAARVGAEHWKAFGGWWTADRSYLGTVVSGSLGILGGWAAKDDVWHKWTPEHPLPVVRAEDVYGLDDEEGL